MSQAVWANAVRLRWAGLQPRERMALSAALAVLAVFLVWSQLRNLSLACYFIHHIFLKVINQLGHHLAWVLTVH